MLLAGALAACSDSADTPAPSGSAEAPTTSDSGECGRDCLIDVLDRYLAAVVDHDPASAPLADNFRGTQNAIPTAAGEGVWQTVTGLGRAQRRYADPESGQAGYVGLIGEGEKIAIAAVRVRVEDHKVSEAEWVIAREGTGAFNPAGFIINPPPGPIDADAPHPDRAAAMAALNSYYEGIESSDPDVVKAHPDCYRVENGFWMVGRMPDRERADPAEAQPGFTAALSPDPKSSCITGFENLRNVTAKVADLHYFFDDEAGVVWSAGVFERVEDAVTRQGDPLPWLYFASVIQVEDGQVRGVYAAMHYLPADVKSSGWPAD